jgi:hypothetical protein
LWWWGTYSTDYCVIEKVVNVNEKSKKLLQFLIFLIILL